MKKRQTFSYNYNLPNENDEKKSSYEVEVINTVKYTHLCASKKKVLLL